MRLIFCVVLAFAGLLHAQQEPTPGPRETKDNGTKPNQNKNPTNQDQRAPISFPFEPPVNTQTGNQHTANNTTGDEQQTTVNIRAVPSLSVQPVKDAADWGVWFFSLMLVVVGVFQYCALRRQAIILHRHSTILRTSVREMTRSVNAYERYVGVSERALAIARQSIILGHPPKLIVLGFRVTGGIEGLRKGDTADGMFEIVNAGGTSARIKEVFATAIIEATLPMRPPDGFSAPVDQELPRGAMLPWNFKKDTGAISQGEAAVLVNPSGDQRRLYVFGFVKYEDTTTPPNTITMRFCRMLDPGTRQFNVVENSNYEHA